MDEILRQPGGLVLGAVPTMILFILLVIAYGLLVRRPLVHVLAERSSRTTGAMEQAKSSIAAAEAETSAYEERLRKAKAEIFAARELKVKQWNAERDAALEQARQAAQMRVGAAKQGIDQSVADARQQIENASTDLSSRILSAVLPASVSTEVA